MRSGSARAKAPGSIASIAEIRRQVREIPGLLEGTAKPDAGRCVDLATKAALRKMVLPGALAVATPVAVGFAHRIWVGRHAHICVRRRTARRPSWAWSAPAASVCSSKRPSTPCAGPTRA